MLIPPMDASEYIMPLNTVLKKKKINEDDLLRKYDRKGDKNMLLSAGEIGEIIKDYLKIELLEEEITIIEEHLRKTFGRKDLKRAEWKQFLLTKSNFECDEKLAKQQQ